MKKVTKIDGIDLDYNLYISTEFDIDDYIGERSVAIDGSSVMFVQAKGSMTREVEVYSKDSGWISEDIKNLLIASVDKLAKVLTFSDSSQETYYYNHSKIPISFTPLYDGSLWYTTTINLVKG